MGTTYYAPTKLFVDEEAKMVGSIIKDYGYKKVLFVYGKLSIKKSGLYDEVVNSLNENGIIFKELGGVSPNPILSFVRKGLELDFDYDMILAVGGGSVIDTAKSLSVSKPSGLDPWKFNNYEEKPKEALPVGVILTIAAAGSEMSNSCVITNDELGLKQGFNSDLIRPKFAIMNPKYTYGVSKYQTACGIVDIMMHTLERFIDDKDGYLADEFSLGLLKTVYENGKIAYENPEDYEARKNLMLASSFSHNGLTTIGRAHYFRCHKFEHVISGCYPEVAHGAGLAVCFPAYSKYVYKNPIALPKYLQFAYKVLGIKETDDKEKDALSGINKLEQFYASLGMPTKMEDLGISSDNLDLFANILTANNTKKVADFIDIDFNVAKQIFKLMWRD